MIVESVLAIVIIIILKAFIESDWVKGEKKIYSIPGILQTPKRVTVKLYYRITKAFQILLNRHPTQFQTDDSLIADLGSIYWNDVNPCKDLTALCFNGFSNEKSNEVADAGIILKLFIHTNGQADIYLYIRVPGSGFLQLPNHPDPLTCRTMCKQGQYKVGGLRLEEIEPNRRWRIAYHGEMRMVDTLADPERWHEGKNLVFAKFNFIWTAYSAVFDCTNDTHLNLLSETLARETWNWDFYRKLKSFRQHYAYHEQWGQLKGRVYVDGMEEGTDGMKLSLRSAREDFKGSLEGCRRYIRVTAHTNEGLTLGLAVASYGDFITQGCLYCSVQSMVYLVYASKGNKSRKKGFISGYVVLPNQALVPIRHCDLRLWRHGEKGNLPNMIQFNVIAGNSSYNVACLLTLKPVSYRSTEHHTRTHDTFADVFVDSVPGKGTVELYYGKPEARFEVGRDLGIPFTSYLPCTETDSKKWTLLLSESDCCDPSLVGAKASRLSRLFTVRDAGLTDEYHVPEGFCITLNAYNAFLKENKTVKKTLEELKDVLKKGSNEDISTKSKVCLAAFADSNLPTKLVAEIKENIQLIKNNFKSGLAVIVRCSHDEMSEETCACPSFGNITCLNQVLNAVPRCWASQFSYDVLLTKRRGGFPVDLGMGIIVEAIHDKERMSGMLLSCQPDTGDPSEITIIPDHFKFNTSPSYFILNKLDDEVYDVSRVYNQHGRSLKLNRRSSETKVSVVNEERKLLLSNDELFRLARISQFVKNKFDYDVDLKWGISPRGNISLFGVKKLMVKHEEIDADFCHEFDSPHARDDDEFIPAEDTDILPLVPTPLTSSTVLKSVILGLQKSEASITGAEVLPFADVGLNLFRGSCHVNLKDLQSSFVFLNFLGETLLDNDLQDKASEVQERDGWKLLKRVFYLTKLLLTSATSEKKLIALTESVKKLDMNPNSSEELYESISSHLTSILSSALSYLVICSAQHHYLLKMLKLILVGNARDKDDAFATSLSTIYRGITSHDNIPASLHELALAIRSDKEEFLSMKPRDAVNWMTSRENRVKELYNDFLLRHGHHSLNECELREQSWKEDQTKIITTIQAVVEKVNSSTMSPNSDVNIILQNINIPLNFFQSCALRLLIPIARKSLKQTVDAKSMLVRNLDVFKQSYSCLAGLLKEQMRLPDEDLLYFLTHQEVGKLVKNFSPHLISKSLSRRRTHGQLVTKKNKITRSSHATSHGNFESGVPPLDAVLRGICVFAKTAEGPARVLDDESEAFLIQEGEILIVKSPDVGWSPYFPLIAGLVAESGNTLSSGCVIARDYGLPCLAGVKNARKCFTSGEMLTLNGNNGTLQRTKSK